MKSWICHKNKILWFDIQVVVCIEWCYSLVGMQSFSPSVRLAIEYCEGENDIDPNQFIFFIDIQQIKSLIRIRIRMIDDERSIKIFFFFLKKTCCTGFRKLLHFLLAFIESSVLWNQNDIHYEHSEFPFLNNRSHSIQKFMTFLIKSACIGIKKTQY